MSSLHAVRRPAPALTMLALVAALPAFALVAQSPPGPSAEEHAARRRAIAGVIGNGALLVVGAEERADSRDRYYQDRNFLWLTGYREPGAALLLRARGGAIEERLFVAPKNVVAELWNGTRLGAEQAGAFTGMRAWPRPGLAPALDSLVRAGDTLFVANDTTPGSAAWRVLRALRASHPELRVRDARPVIARARGKKSPAEQALLARSAELTTLGMGEVLRAIEPGVHEFELEALLEYTYRRNGGDGPGFPQIVASGPNALTLHYFLNDRAMQPGELVLMDVGASFHGYVSDYTRTAPVSGRFTDDQRTIYRIVRDAQAAAERGLGPGVRFAALADSTRAVLAAGLTRLGLIESPTATYDLAPGEPCAAPQQGGCPQWFAFYMHSLGHGVGLDVHDPDQSMGGGTLGDGSVMMLEVGIYVRPNLFELIPDTPRNRAFRARAEQALRRYAGIAVRLEDKYLVTATGREWLTRSPREAEEIEAVMRERWSAPAARDPSRIARFPRPRG